MSSVYNQVSRFIGWTGCTVDFPTKEEAEKIVRESAEGNSDSFTQLFRWYRFLGPANTSAEIDIINIVYHGFHTTKQRYGG